MNLTAIATALLAYAPSGIADSAIGLNQATAKTPFLEVVPLRGRLQSLAAGAGRAQLRVADFEVAIYVAMAPNLESDERLLLPLLEGYINNLGQGDPTLGGLVEEVRATEFEFGISLRNNRPFRYASLRVVVGELDQEGT